MVSIMNKLEEQLDYLNCHSRGTIINEIITSQLKAFK